MGSATTAVYPQQSLLGPRVNSNPLPLFFFQSKCAEIGVCFNSTSTSFFFFCLSQWSSALYQKFRSKSVTPAKMFFKIWLLPLRRLKVAILKWPIPLVNFYLNSGQFLEFWLMSLIFNVSTCTHKWPIQRKQQKESATSKC